VPVPLCTAAHGVFVITLSVLMFEKWNGGRWQPKAKTRAAILQIGSGAMYGF
jgi:hypothetical protein